MTNQKNLYAKIVLMKKAVVVHDLSISYDGKLKALDKVSLNIPAGQITGLIGPSGSGKTTLIKAIVGRLKLPADKVTVLGLPAGTSHLRSSVAYMAQELAVYADLTVKQNLSYFAKVAGLDRAKAKSRVEQVLVSVDLVDKQDAIVSDLSGGQMQRVSLGVAILGRPKLLVFDEPTVGLDPVLIESLWKLFRQLIKGGSTIIISSHSMGEARRCDDLVLMRAGNIIATGEPRELMKKTKTPSIEQAFLSLVKEAK
jgi:ABC-2 type transport system ATP-binding protein